MNALVAFPKLAFPQIARRKQVSLAALRDQIRRLEGFGGGAAVVPLGVPAVDACLPGGGLPLGRIEAVTAADPGAGTGFCAWALARVALATGKPAAWIVRGRDLYAPGLAAYGLTPDRLIAVRAPRGADALWALEECLRSRRLSAALLEVDRVDMTAGRRLQLAAEAGGTAGFLLFGAQAGKESAARAPTAALRWRAAPVPTSPGENRMDWPAICWDVALERAQAGKPGVWRLTGDAAVVSASVAAGDALPATPARWAAAS